MWESENVDEARVTRRWLARTGELAPLEGVLRVPSGQLNEQMWLVTDSGNYGC